MTTPRERRESSRGMPVGSQPSVTAEIADGLRLRRAVDSLRRARPALSAAEPIWPWQRVFFLSSAAILGLAAAAAPHATLSALLAMLALPFFCVVILRTLALWHRGTASAGLASALPCLADRDLPLYTVMVPLYREAGVVRDLLDALSRIDYPRGKLEVLLIVESIDGETRQALAAASLEPHMRVIVVPDGTPRTKPRALNFALEHASGAYVVVYDAEDAPEPDQLRRALGVLLTDPRVGCVQARLNVYNAGASWLTRQFAIEYTALFDCLLPMLERLRLPVPLGGTSNHFPRAVLDEVGRWDPYNVTEDADLGIRLARRGWRVEVLASTTWEEAPARLDVWLRQRTRWLKGWMQTYLVHMREPLRLARELGPRRVLGLQVLMGGLILSSLVHPWFYVLASLEAAQGALSTSPGTAATRALWWLGLFNLVAGYATGMALGAAAVAGRGRSVLAAHALLMPVYWLLISAAAYRALWQLATDPYLWEKTEHTPRSKGPGGHPAKPSPPGQGAERPLSRGGPPKNETPPARSGRRLH